MRHAGLLGAIELEPGVSARCGTVLAARERGVLTRALRGTALQFSPAFVSTDDDSARWSRRLPKRSTRLRAA